MSSSPVERIPSDKPDEPLTEGTALCLSGGGYRAMVFHVGVLWRLHEADLLRNLQRVSSVSGGSITAAILALAWDKLVRIPRLPNVFESEVVAPIRRLADETIDAESIIFGLVLPGRISDR